jgi:hypothetical protein
MFRSHCLIANHVKTYTVSKPILMNDPNETWETSEEIVISNLGASPTIDIAPMDIQIVVANDLCKMQQSVICSDMVEPRSGKNNRNHKRNRSWLNNCKKRDEESRKFSLKRWSWQWNFIYRLSAAVCTNI